MEAEKADFKDFKAYVQKFTREINAQKQTIQLEISILEDKLSKLNREKDKIEHMIK